MVLLACADEFLAMVTEEEEVHSVHKVVTWSSFSVRYKVSLVVVPLPSKTSNHGMYHL